MGSNLIPDLRETHRTKRENMVAINKITNPITGIKLLLLHSVKNIEPTDKVKTAAESVTVEAVELAVTKHTDEHYEDMALFDDKSMCASVTKNGINLLTAEELQRELSHLRSEISGDLKRESASLKSEMAAKDQAVMNSLRSEVTNKDNALRRELKSLYFDVYRSSNWYTNLAIITYEGTETSSVGSAINLSSGKFTAPEKGVYRFTFNGNVVNPSGKSGAAVVFLKKDGRTIASSKESSPSSDINEEATISINSMTELNAGQVVYLQWKVANDAFLDGGHNAGKLYDGGPSRRYIH